MSETRLKTLTWSFVALIGLSASVLLYGGSPATASNDHDVARALRNSGDIRPLSELLQREELAGMRVLEAELDYEHGRAVYELELLDNQGRVSERYYDAATGEPLRNFGD
jgi:uncharacterized membrane protein YkoI